MLRTSSIPILFFCASASTVSAQGLLPEWESRKLAQTVVDSTLRLNPVLSQINPVNWTQNGAPEAYTHQLQNIKNGLGYISISAKQFSADPQSISAALDTYMRLQWLEAHVGSLEQGIRKYQNPALADLLAAAVSDSATTRTQMQQYVLDLAKYRETEMSVMSKEAQQCRSAVTHGQVKPNTKERTTK